MINTRKYSLIAVFGTSLFLSGCMVPGSMSGSLLYVRGEGFVWDGDIKYRPLFEEEKSPMEEELERYADETEETATHTENNP